ncbi:uncharacterized protein DNG_01898 [Cephalotrichum gorgonifer]|uniref:protein O-GlcNAc transferase n=1 Tax=Cephalotrichum gorgonifer TaxID=2041049 RepID=A0AAE8MU43_9PEZI|nr:uncharacterized protein DNG_01898 [Cephalotrichum gorgonifer]
MPSSILPNGHGQSEHALRRKTPSGTIDAGYDGSPAQLISGPPPFKQVILPAAPWQQVPSLGPQNPTHELDLSSFNLQPTPPDPAFAMQNAVLSAPRPSFSTGPSLMDLAPHPRSGHYDTQNQDGFAHILDSLGPLQNAYQHPQVLHTPGYYPVLARSPQENIQHPWAESFGDGFPVPREGSYQFTPGDGLALIHAKGTMLYGLKDVIGAAEAFEEAVLISAGRKIQCINNLVKRIHHVLSPDSTSRVTSSLSGPTDNSSLLLPPQRARHTAQLVFSPSGELPGVRYIVDGVGKRAAVQTTSNSLLSLAKIFQDAMSTGTSTIGRVRQLSGVGDILALYYLSLSLQDSPSTANNVGILLASVQQPSMSHQGRAQDSPLHPNIPGIVPGSGLSLALAYYRYGLTLDPTHVHLHTNLGSLLKDIGQLDLAIQMYEKAVQCDGTFDIALTNLANAVKDRGRIGDAIIMQSVFGFHDPSRVKAFCYATTASDYSVHRQKIEREAPVFRDASGWSPDRLVGQIVQDGIHILVNLNGYTRGARNEIFAARPVPIQMSFMGFAGTLGAEWCDYILADSTAIPRETLRPWRGNRGPTDLLRDNNEDDRDDWMYSENIIFCRDTFFCCDHAQSSGADERQVTWHDEQRRRWEMRKSLFPELADDAIILGNFNQLYKIDPTTFRSWLRILSHVPKAVLWLLKFPELGEGHLRRTAVSWAGAHVAKRIVFTEVAPKSQHIARGRVCDLFLDTPECNAHTTAADVLWSSTPLLTLPRYPYKMCSRMAASILRGALPKTEEGERVAKELTAGSDEQYERTAVEFASGLSYVMTGDGYGIGHGRLAEIRRLLFESRWTCALFDTRRWVGDVEQAYEEAWRKWVCGEVGDIYL